MSALALKAYVYTLAMVFSLRYLGRTFAVVYNDWIDAVKNILNVRKMWARLLWIMGREGEDTSILGLFYLSVV